MNHEFLIYHKNLFSINSTFRYKLPFFQGLAFVVTQLNKHHPEKKEKIYGGFSGKRAKRETRNDGLGAGGQGSSRKQVSFIRSPSIPVKSLKQRMNR